MAGAQLPALPRSSWRELRARLRRDRERLAAYHARYGLPGPGPLLLNPSFQCLLLHRVSHHFYRNGRRLLARLFWHLNLVLTGADMSPITQLGAGAVVVHPMSTLMFGRAGEDCTFWGHCGFGGGRSAEDIGAGAGFPVIGDRVDFGTRTIVLGPVRVGDDCVIEAGCIVTRHVPPRSVVAHGGRLIKVAP